MKAIIFSLLFVCAGTAFADITVETGHSTIYHKTEPVTGDQYIKISGEQANGLFDQMKVPVIENGSYAVKVIKMGADSRAGVVECVRSVDYVTRKPLGTDARCYIGSERLLPPGVADQGN